MAHDVPNLRPLAGWRRRLLLTLVLSGSGVFAGAMPLRADSPAMPPLVSPASPDHHPGKPIFLQLVTPDLDTAKLFYGTLFGWKFRNARADALDIAVASVDGQPIASLVHRDFPNGVKRQPAWVAYFAVQDVDAAGTLAVQHGAKVLQAPHTLAGFGREAIYADPQGAVFGTLASATGDPPDELVAPGAWIWSTLLTTDPDTDTAFYQSLFDYEVFDLPEDAGGEHFLLASDDDARASANRLPPGPSQHPHWLNFIRVVDADATIAELTKLGGHVLVPPRVDRHGGRVAVVSDPSGAPFGLMEWTSADNKDLVK